jgi:hypothetical protein
MLKCWLIIHGMNLCTAGYVLLSSDGDVDRQTTHSFTLTPSIIPPAYAHSACFLALPSHTTIADSNAMNQRDHWFALVKAMPQVSK